MIEIIKGDEERGDGLSVVVDKGKGCHSIVNLRPHNKADLTIQYPKGEKGLSSLSFFAIPIQHGKRDGHRYEQEGWTIEDLLALAYMRLRQYQEKDIEGIPCLADKKALDYIDCAFTALQERMRDREERGVLGEKKE